MTSSSRRVCSRGPGVAGADRTRQADADCRGRGGGTAPGDAARVALGRGYRERGDRAARRRRFQELGHARTADGPPARARGRTARSCNCARRRRDRGLGGLRERHPEARLRLRTGADDLAGAGRFVGRRQDRHQHAGRQEPRRRLPPAGDRAHRSDDARYPAVARSPCGLCRGGQIRPDRRPRVLRLVRSQCRPAARGDPEAREIAIARSVAAKARIVGEDERETSGRRALLNLGHTFGHALEAEAGFDGSLLHGEAVAAGMALAFAFSASRGLCPPEDAARVAAHLRAAGLPDGLAAAGISASGARLVDHMRHDKKMEGGTLALLLAHGSAGPMSIAAWRWKRSRRSSTRSRAELSRAGPSRPAIASRGSAACPRSE